MKIKRLQILFYLLLIWGGSTVTANAHMSNYSYSDIKIRGQLIKYELRIAPNDLDHIVTMDSNNDGVVDQTEYEDNLNKVDNALAPWLAKHVKVSNNSSQCNPNYGGFELKESNVILFKVLYRCNEPADDLVINSTVFRETDAKHQNYAKISFKDNTRDFVFREGKDQFSLIPKNEASSLWHDLKEFTVLGLEHIFSGYDHILFIFGLIILGGSLRNLIKIVTSFTVAHSITLIFATLGFIRLSPMIVEPLIALTIAYIGIENLFIKNIDKRWVLTFFFGLIHGLGFAGVLREMNLPAETLVTSLVSFNVGVELGQVVIVSLLYPFIYVMGKYAWRKRMVQGLSFSIIFLALYWFIERIT